MTAFIQVKDNTKQMERRFRKISKDTAPKVIASAMTDTLFVIRDRAIKKWWPNSLEARNKSFIRAALNVGRARSATLKGSLFDRLKRVSISSQTERHTRTGRGGRRAVPTRRVENRKTTTGKIPASMRTSNKGVFKQGDSLYKSTGRGKSKKVQKLYTLKGSVSQPRTFRFYELAERTAGREYPRAFFSRLRKKLR